MAITYSAGAGTTITTHAMNETLPASQPSDLTQVRVSDDISTAGNGQIGDGSNGVGNSYVGRLLIINLGTDDIIRMCVGETDEGTTFLLDVNEAYDTQPVGSTDTIHVAYEIADIEDGGAGGGIAWSPTFQQFILSNVLTIASAGGLQNCFGIALELDDRGATTSIVTQSGGYFYSGYDAFGRAVDGGLFISINNVAGEEGWEFQSGSFGSFHGCYFFAREVTMQFECAAGSSISLNSCTFAAFTDELFLYDATVNNINVPGRAGSVEIVRLDDGSVIDGLNLSNLYALDSEAGTTTETITATGVLFNKLTNILTVRDNKTWNLIDPLWGVTIYSDLDDAAVTGTAAVNDRRSVAAVVQEADGTLLQDAVLTVYEGSTDDLVVEEVTGADGVISSSFIYKEHTWTTGTGSTTTFSNHAIQVGKWLYLPFVAAQDSDGSFNSTVVQSPDNNIVQTTQATAKTAGASVTWNEDTNPSEIIDFTSGSGTGLEGMILTFSPSGAVGTLTFIIDGDSTAGTIHMKTRNATAIASGDTFSRTGGTAGTFSGTYTAATAQPFSIYIDAATLSYQGLYDYLAAIQHETTLGTDGKLIREWCRSAQAQPLYATGSSFYTERSNSKGIIVVDGGAGTIDYYTDDAGNTWVPPTTVTLEITVQDVGQVVIQNAQTSIFLLDSPFTQLMNEDTTALGVASESYSYVGVVDIVYKVRKSDDLDSPRYQPFSGIGQITASGFTATVTLEVNPFL